MAAFANVYLKRWSHTEPFVILPAAMLLSGIACSALGLALEPFNFAAARAPGAWVSLLYLSLAAALSRSISITGYCSALKRG